MKIDLKLVIFGCATFVLLAGCGKKVEHGSSASDALADAQKLYDAGQLQAARKAIETALKVDPKLRDAHWLAARIAEKSGDMQTALAEYVYVGADAAGRDNEKARLAATALLFRAHAYKLAEEWIARCLADRPGDHAMKAYRALLRQRLGDTNKARLDAEAILADHTNNVVANAVLAEQALDRKDPASALIRIEAGLSTEPSDKALLQLKAQASSQQERPEQAIAIYNDLLAADPTAPDTRAALAELIAKTSGVAPGEGVLRQGIEADPGNIEMRMQLIAFISRHRDKKALVDELVAAINSAPDIVNFDIALAEVDARDNGFDAAAKVLNDAIARTRSESARSTAQLALARLLIAHDDTAGARSIVDSMLKDKVAEDEVIAVSGQLKLQDRDARGAIQDFLSVASRQPANAAIFASLAAAYLRNDQRGEAVAALMRILSLRPSDAGTLLRIVEIHTGFGEVASAGRAVEDFQAHNPASIEARVMRIRLAIQSKDWTAADVALTELNRIPNSEAAAVGLDAEIKEARGQPSDAAALYRRLVLRKDDGRFDVSVARAFVRASIAAGQGSQALDTVTRLAANVAPTDQSSYDLILADLSDALGQTEKSQALVEAAIRKAPADPAPYLQQADSLVRKKQNAKAVDVLLRGIAAGAEKEPLLTRRAEIEIAEGRTDDAIQTYRDLLRVNPKSVVGANELANLLADRTPLDRAALREARDCLERNAEFRHPAILDTLAWSAYRLGEFERAKKLLSLANADRSANPQLRFHNGAVLIESGERAKGQEIIRNTLNDTYPGRTEAEELLK